MHSFFLFSIFHYKQYAVCAVFIQTIQTNRNAFIPMDELAPFRSEFTF